MTHRHQARAALLTALLLITSLPILPAAAEAEGACCEMDEFNLFLTGEAENGDLTPASYTHLRAHETSLHLVCPLPLAKQNTPSSTS